jgi:iron complex transport system ATP-binding protein
MAEISIALKNVEWSPASGKFSLGPFTADAGRARFIALVGPNGAGKTSLLNLIGGLMPPSAGSIEIEGASLRLRSPRERGRILSYLSQDPERPFGFPVREYVLLGRYPHNGPFRRPGSEDLEVVRREISAWGLDGLEERSVATLSGGEFQRVRLARALAQEPAILLLDEPGNHLDLTSRMDILERLSSEAYSGRCVIAVLHDVNDALLFADEVWLLDSGRLLDAGNPHNVLFPERLAEVYGRDLTPFRDNQGRMMLGIPLRRRQ